MEIKTSRLRWRIWGELAGAHHLKTEVFHMESCGLSHGGMGSGEGRRSLLLIGAMIGWAWNMGTRVGIPAVLPFIRERYALTTAEASSIPAALNLGYYLTSLYSGRLSQRLGLSRALIGYLVGAAVISCLFGLSGDRTSLYATAVAMGVLMSLHIPSAIPMISSRFRGGRLGFVIGVHETAAPLGQVIGPLALSYLITSIGYDWSFAAWSVLAFASAAVLLSSRTGMNPEGSGGSAAGRIDRRTGAAITVLTVGALTGNLGVVAVLPLHLVDTFGLEKGFVASLIGLSRSLSVVGQLAGGFMFDRLGFRRTAALLTSLNAATMLYLTFGPFGDLYVMAMVVSPLVTAMFFPVMYAYVAALLGTGSGPMLGRALGVGGLVGATLMPAVAGSVAELYGYTAALSVPTAIVCLSAVALFASSFPAVSEQSRS